MCAVCIERLAKDLPKFCVTRQNRLTENATTAGVYRYVNSLQANHADVSSIVVEVQVLIAGSAADIFWKVLSLGPKFYARLV